MLLLFMLYIVLFGILLWTYASPSRRRFYPWMKLCTSLGFTGIAIFAAYQSSRFDLLALMLPGLLFSTAGDLVLGFARIRGHFSGKEMFTGILCFATAHIFFYLTFAQIYPPVPADFLLPFLVCLAVFLLIRHPRMNAKRMHAPCIVYAYFVGLLVSKSLTSVVLFGVSPASLLFLSGSILFLFSDFILIFLNFYREPKSYFIYMNLITYYAATALIGTTLLFF